MCGRCISGFGFLGWRFTGRDAGADRRRVVGDSCWRYFLTNGLNLHRERANDDPCLWCRECVRVCGERLCETGRPSAHLETNFLQQGVEVIEQPAAIEDERRLQHLLVNLFIIQFLRLNDRAVMTKKKDVK